MNPYWLYIYIIHISSICSNCTDFPVIFPIEKGDISPGISPELCLSPQLRCLAGGFLSHLELSLHQPGENMWKNMGRGYRIILLHVYPEMTWKAHGNFMEIIWKTSDNSLTLSLSLSIRIWSNSARLKAYWIFWYCWNFKWSCWTLTVPDLQRRKVQTSSIMDDHGR